MADTGFLISLPKLDIALLLGDLLDAEPTLFELNLYRAVTSATGDLYGCAVAGCKVIAPADQLVNVGPFVLCRTDASSVRRHASRIHNRKVDFFALAWTLGQIKGHESPEQVGEACEWLANRPHRLAALRDQHAPKSAPVPVALAAPVASATPALPAPLVAAVAAVSAPTSVIAVSAAPMPSAPVSAPAAVVSGDMDALRKKLAALDMFKDDSDMAEIYATKRAKILGQMAVLNAGTIQALNKKLTALDVFKDDPDMASVYAAKRAKILANLAALGIVGSTALPLAVAVVPAPAPAVVPTSVRTALVSALTPEPPAASASVAPPTPATSVPTAPTRPRYEVERDNVERERIDLAARATAARANTVCNMSGGSWKGDPLERPQFIPGFELEEYLTCKGRYRLPFHAEDYETPEDCFGALGDTGPRYRELLNIHAPDGATNAEMRQHDSEARKAAKGTMRACRFHGPEGVLLAAFRGMVIKRINDKWPERWQSQGGNGHSDGEYSCQECGNKVDRLYTRPISAKEDSAHAEICGTCRKRIKNALTKPHREAAAVARSAADLAWRGKTKGPTGQQGGSGKGKKGKGGKGRR